MKLNTEDYNFINQYEKEFGHAVNESYFRIVNRSILRECAEIYKRVFNKDSKILNGCNRCVLADIKTLATIYFKDKAEKEAIEAKETPAIELIQPECATTETKTEKAATKKKTASKNKKK